MAAKQKPVEVQKRMVLNLMVSGVKVHLTREGKSELWGEKVERILCEGGTGMKITYGEKKHAIG